MLLREEPEERLLLEERLLESRDREDDQELFPDRDRVLVDLRDEELVDLRLDADGFDGLRLEVEDLDFDHPLPLRSLHFVPEPERLRDGVRFTSGAGERRTGVREVVLERGGREVLDRVDGRSLRDVLRLQPRGAG